MIRYSIKRFEPLEATVLYNGSSRGIWLVVNRGNTFVIKEQLKEAGCKFITYSESRHSHITRKAWAIFIAQYPNEDELPQRAYDAMQKLEGLGVLIRIPVGTLGDRIRSGAPLNQA